VIFVSLFSNTIKTQIGETILKCFTHIPILFKYWAE